MQSGGAPCLFHNACDADSCVGFCGAIPLFPETGWGGGGGGGGSVAHAQCIAALCVDIPVSPLLSYNAVLICTR